jgi:hypothetical protein
VGCWRGDEGGSGIGKDMFGGLCGGLDGVGWGGLGRGW